MVGGAELPLPVLFCFSPRPDTALLIQQRECLNREFLVSDSALSERFSGANAACEADRAGTSEDWSESNFVSNNVAMMFKQSSSH
jgi:hypothetical protein